MTFILHAYNALNTEKKTKPNLKVKIPDLIVVTLGECVYVNRSVVLDSL